MKIIPFTYCSNLELYANTYLLVDDKDNCVVIDPGKDYSGIVDFIKENELHLKAILLTHGHFDHIRGIENILKEYPVDVYINEKDKKYLSDPHFNGSERFSRKNVILNIQTRPLKDGEILKLIDGDIKVIHTPYHSEGSVVFYLKDNNALISGDSLFKDNYGRMDFPGSNPDLFKSSMNKILSLPEETTIYPGHNETTTIKHERINYGFVKK
ncbi:MAG: MBL fold metallo-hydrolase [Bacilli bacterium]|nr:MBL fold metallo-hydrolase [Bacilli bacterium]